MQPIQKVLQLHRNDYYRTHLALINAMLPVKMTDREMQIIAKVMSFSGELSEDKFGPLGRSILKRDLGFSDGGLGNFVRSMRDKGFIIHNERGVEDIRPILNVAPDEQVYMFKLINLN